MYTEFAIQQQKTIKDRYPKLAPFYQSRIGNFEFTKTEIRQNLSLILDWMEEFDTYKLVMQEGYFYLTDFEV